MPSSSAVRHSVNTKVALERFHFLCHKKPSLISSTIIRNPLPAVPLEHISLINDLIKNTCGIMKGVIFFPIQSNTFYLGASEGTLSDIVQSFKGTHSANRCHTRSFVIISANPMTWVTLLFSLITLRKLLEV